jgi:hypothetical protein
MLSRPPFSLESHEPRKPSSPRTQRKAVEMSKEAAAAKTDDESDPVPRNEFGGVYVDEEELRAAFDFFDVHKKGTLVRVCKEQVLVLRARSLARRAHSFAPSLPLPFYVYLCLSVSPCLFFSRAVALSQNLAPDTDKGSRSQRACAREDAQRVRAHARSAKCLRWCTRPPPI